MKAFHQGGSGFFAMEGRQSRIDRNWNYGVMKNFSVTNGRFLQRGNRRLVRVNTTCCEIHSVSSVSNKHSINQK